MFSCCSFKDSYIALRSFTYFEIIFVQVEKLASSFSLLHMDIQFSQHHLLDGSRWILYWRECFLSNKCFCTLVKNQMAVAIWDFSGSSILFHLVSVCFVTMAL
jgi:hypothetical protein